MRNCLVMKGKQILVLCRCCFLCLVLAALTARGEAVDLLQRYPTKLTAGDTKPEDARSWEFMDGDIYRVTQFRLEVGKDLRVEIGPADLGIGHCGADGAVWAVLIPRNNGTLTRQVTNQEAIAHLWLRFHPEGNCPLVLAGDSIRRWGIRPDGPGCA